MLKILVSLVLILTVASKDKGKNLPDHKKPDPNEMRTVV
jgi:hypothetical protein